MIHFSAFAKDAPQDPVPDNLARQWASGNVFPGLTNRWTYSQGNVFMFVQGDCDLTRFVHTSPRLVLVCHAELLGFDSGNHFWEANQCPASYLARLYEQEGDSFARSLCGWFGIVIYDHEQNTLKAWTDHFGVRRIVYRSIPGALGVASDLRLLQGFFDQAPEVDPQAILEYLQYTCIPAPRTIYKGMLRLEPGHGLASRPKVSSGAYWDMHYEEVKGSSLQAWASEAYEAIQSAVARAAKMADSSQRPGCFLSGGTDSSSISGLVGQLTGRQPTTLSIGFDHPRYNEIRYARIAARHFHADHHEYFVKPDDILNLLQRAYTVYDEPFGNSSIVPTYYCARMGAESGITHMLAGDGGDELFGGNQRYADDRIFQRYFLIPRPVRTTFIEPLVKAACDHLRAGPVSLAQRYIRRANIPVPDRYLSYDFLSNVDWTDLFEPSFRLSLDGTDVLSTARQHFHSARATSELNRWLYLDIKITITDNDLRKVTPMTELAGIVPRYPFLDPVLAEFSGKIPSTLKVRGVQLRYLFKQAMSSVLPQEILTKKKHGFGLPFSVWLNEHRALRDYVFDILGSSAARQRGYFRKDLPEWLASFCRPDSATYYGSVFWIFLMLELWHLCPSQHLPRGR